MGDRSFVTASREESTTRSALDIVYHIGIVAVLVWGVAVAWRARMVA